MQKIPVITFLLWVVIVSGYKFFPEYFLNGYLQYPLIILLSIFIPVSFWLKSQLQQKIKALIFIAIFFINVSLLIFAIEKNYSKHRVLEHKIVRGIIPEVAELLSDTGNVEKAKSAARFIYQKFAVSMPYVSSDRDFILYSPSEADKENYREKSAQDAHLKVVAMNINDQMLSAFFLLVLHVGIFLLVLIFLCIYDDRRNDDLSIKP